MFHSLPPVNFGYESTQTWLFQLLFVSNRVNTYKALALAVRPVD